MTRLASVRRWRRYRLHRADSSFASSPRRPGLAGVAARWLSFTRSTEPGSCGVRGISPRQTACGLMNREERRRPSCARHEASAAASLATCFTQPFSRATVAPVKVTRSRPRPHRREQGPGHHGAVGVRLIDWRWTLRPVCGDCGAALCRSACSLRHRVIATEWIWLRRAGRSIRVTWRSDPDQLVDALRLLRGILAQHRRHRRPRPIC